MTFGWINAVNAVFVIVLIAVSVIGQKKSGVPAMESRQKLLNILEQLGRYASMLLMILPLLPGWEFGFSSEVAMVAWMVLPVLLLISYALLWTQAKKGGAVLYGLAILPALLLFCCGLLLRHWALVGAAAVFGVSHTLIVRECLGFIDHTKIE